MIVPAIILAGGASTRMGSPKALLPDADGRPFAVRIVETLAAAGVDEIVMVLGFHAAPVREVVDALPLPLRLVENPQPERGQLSSLQSGLAIVDRPGITAALVTLVDIPFVLPETVRTLIDAYRRSRASIVRPVAGARHGHPVIFDRRVFLELRQADPALGAKPIITAHAADILDVEVTDEGAFADIDTRDDYERLLGSSRM